MKLLILGDAHTDLIFNSETSKQLLQKKISLTKELYPLASPHLGGAGANTAVAAAALNLNTTLLAVCGSDIFAKDRLYQLHQAGVDTNLMVSSPLPNLLVPVAVDPHGERIFLSPEKHDSLADDMLSLQQIPTDLPFKYDIFYTTGIQLLQEPMRTTCLHLAKAFYAAKKPVVFDCNLRFSFTPQNHKDYYTMFSYCHTVSGSDMEELCIITNQSTPQKAADTILQMGCQQVIFKCGSRGADLYTKGRAYHCPALPVTVADTLGAGDTFAGGVLAAMAEHSSPHEILKLATLAAAYEIQFHGSGTVGNKEQLQQLREQFDF